jgi:acyl-CoA oxidase
MASGLPYLYQSYVSTNTLEGENFLLTQQTARFLLKELKAVIRGTSKSISTQFIKRLSNPSAFKTEKFNVSSESDLQNHEHLVHAFSHRAARLLVELAELLKKKSWNDVNIEVSVLSRAFSQYMVIMISYKFLEQVKVENAALYPVIKKCIDLFAIYTLEKEIGGFLEDGYINQEQVRIIHNTLLSSLKEFQPHAIGLTDAFDFSDYFLNSALGRADGRVYESIYEWSLKEPLNNPEVLKETINKYIRPVIDGKL